MKKIREKIITGVAFIAVLAIYLVMSLRGLYVDVINPDGINWHNRTLAFVQGLTSHKYSDTYQVYHPGTTLMWISGPVLRIFSPDSFVKRSSDESKTDFLQRDYNAKLSLIIFCTLVFVFTLVLIQRMSGTLSMVAFGLLMALEPFAIGERRLYHLDFLMTSTLFLSFLLLCYYNFKSAVWFLLPLAALFFVISVLTKTTAVMFLPVIPFLFILGNSKYYVKIIAVPIFILSTIIFTYALFPAIWRNPVNNAPKYFNELAFGVSDIGIKGKEEMGSSGKSANIILEGTVMNRDLNFYVVSLFMRLSPQSWVLLLISVGMFITAFLMGLVKIIIKSVRNKTIPNTLIFQPGSWVALFSLGFSVAVILALTLSQKKLDRYVITVFPFLFSVVAYLFSRLKYYVAIPVLVIYTAYAFIEGQSYYPYYMAYSNPYLGGLETRLRVVDDAPFGIATYEAFERVKMDLAESGTNSYYTIAGPKSVKAISAGGKFSRVPSCVTDYVVSYAFDNYSVTDCANKYKLIDKVTIGGFDYWYIYKRLNQKHESNYD